MPGTQNYLITMAASPFLGPKKSQSAVSSEIRNIHVNGVCRVLPHKDDFAQMPILGKMNWYQERPAPSNLDI